MAYTRTVLCLAKSYKHGGHCFAGKDIETSEWIRPVSNRADEEISDAECMMTDGIQAKVLDVLEIPFLIPKPLRHQTENHLIDPSKRWKKTGDGTWRQVVRCLDDHNGPLWKNESASQGYERNRVAETSIKIIVDSLILIRPKALAISIERKGGQYADANKRLVKARFVHDGIEYTLAVTDPVVTDRFHAGPNRTDDMTGAILCVSLGEIHRGDAYKLVAAVLNPPEGA